MSASDQRAVAAPTRIVLIRHGESQVTVDRVIGGARTCSGLSPLGRRQTERLRDRLAATAELAGAVLISSDFARAVETARIIAPPIVGENAGAGDLFVVDAGFGEHDPGPDLDGVSFDTYVERFGSPRPDAELFPGGETFAAFGERVDDAVARAIARHAGRLIVVSCHGGVVDRVFRRLLHLPPAGEFDLWTLNSTITEFHHAGSPSGPDLDERWRLVRYNDAAHLAGLPAATPR